jgi:hypothetical protein
LIAYSQQFLQLVQGGVEVRRAVVFAGLAVLVALVFAGPLTAQGATSFYTVSPCRVLDTRDPAGPFGGPALTPGTIRVLNLAGRCGLSTGASAVSANVTIVSPTSGGYLLLYPAGGVAPPTSTLNYAAGQVRANNAILPLGADGAVTVLTGQPGGSLHVLVDVNGYFADPAIDQTLVAPPVLTPPPGSYNGGQSVTLTTSTPGAQIRYTTDGSTPTSSTGALYTGPVGVSSTTTIKAIAYAAGLSDSSVVSGLYTISHQPTLFIATMVPQSGVQSPGSGSATLLLDGSETFAVLRFTYSNLTTPTTGGPVSAAGPADRARQQFQSPERRPVHRPPAHPEAGDQQS